MNLKFVLRRFLILLRKITSSLLNPVLLVCFKIISFWAIEIFLDQKSYIWDLVFELK